MRPCSIYMHPLASDMLRLFRGYEHFYGVYKLTGEMTESGKVMGKPYVVAGTVDDGLWDLHLTGKKGLGIVPINESNCVSFGAIDIDDYQVDQKTTAIKIAENKMPLVACRTKSGGLHLYLFLDDWCSAKLVQQKLREMAAFLGHGSAEIFPKQDRILAERGDRGNWINMPYFNEINTDRYAVDQKGSKLNIREFLKYAQSMTTSAEALLSMKYGTKKELLREGPPCLNHLCEQGFPMGTRNTGLFNLGVYCRKSDPDNWEAKLREYNTLYMNPALSETEINGVIKSLNKEKEYLYTCKQAPICNHCNMNKCRTKRHGIGFQGAGMPKFGSLTKHTTVPPIWFLDIEGGGRLELETEDLYYQRNYIIKCMEVCNAVPPILKQDVWNEIVGRLLEEVTILQVPEEATPKGQLKEYLREFCTSRVQSKSIGEIILGKVWTSSGRHYFRIRDFIKFLERQKFNDFKKNQITTYLKDWGAQHHFFNIKGQGTNCTSVKEFDKQTEGHDLPSEITQNPY